MQCNTKATIREEAGSRGTSSGVWKWVTESPVFVTHHRPYKMILDMGIP